MFDDEWCDEWPSHVEVPQVDWTPPAVVGVLYLPDGVLVVEEPRPTFGFGRHLDA